MPKKQTRPATKPTPIRFTEAMLAEVSEVAERFNLSRQDVLRISVAAGLEAMRHLGFEGLMKTIASHFPGMDTKGPKDGDPPSVRLKNAGN